MKFALHSHDVVHYRCLEHAYRQEAKSDLAHLFFVTPLCIYTAGSQTFNVSAGLPSQGGGVVYPEFFSELKPFHQLPLDA